MVSKKKVSKRVVISGNEDAKKKSDKISNKWPAVELLNVAPPGNGQTTIPPTGATNVEPVTPSSVEEPVIETSDDKLTTLLKEEPIIQKPEVQSNMLKNIVLIFFSVIVLFWLTVAILSLEVHKGPHIEERNISLIRKVAINLSFDEMISSQDNSKEISLQGMLRLERINTTPQGSMIESYRDMNYVIDDYGKKIEVRLELSQKVEYEKLFTSNTKVKTVYNVTGVYVMDTGIKSIVPNNMILYPISSIQPFTRTLLEVNEWKTENITIPDKKGVTFNIAQGWGKVNALI